MKKRRHLSFALISAFIGILAFASAAEIVLRFLPVQTPLRNMATGDTNPILRLKPGQEFVYSNDGVFSIVAKGWVNGHGFVNDQEYLPDGPGPLLAIIGDSFVEALMVEHPATLQGRLATNVGDRGRVYSFARSGAALSQYLAYADWVRQKFRPDGMVFVVVGNDFDESLSQYGRTPGMHVYMEDEDGKLILKRRDFSPNWKGKVLLWIADRSRLISYLIFNLNLQTVYHTWKAARIGRAFQAVADAWPFKAAKALEPDIRFADKTSANPDSVRRDLSRRAIAAFFRDLPAASGLPPDRILFVLDGKRNSDASDQNSEGLAKSYLGAMRWELMVYAKKHGYGLIDMQPVFIARHRAYGTKFIFRTDGHWNAAAHGAVAERIAASPLFETLFVRR